VNVLKFYPIRKNLSLYGLVGAGYENLGNHFSSNSDTGFVNYGVGIKYTLKNDIAIRAEVRHAINFNHGDNNLFYNVGFSIPFGKKAAPMPEYKPEPVAKVAPKPAPVVVLDDDKDGIINEKDACPNTPMGVQVDEKGCELDSDHDGVVNTQDQCPNTPAGNVVNADGCVKVVHLKVEFASDKANIPEGYMAKIKEVSNFMAINKTYKVTLEGNTDSVGSKKYNQALSLKRAKAVAGALETLGIVPDRINTKGFGEMNPIASNKTATGRAQNRRVDAKFNKGE